MLPTKQGFKKKRKKKKKKKKKKESIEWTEFPEGALNFIFKRSLLCAKKHYKKE